MRIKIDSVIVKKRIRKDNGNIQALANSLKEHGLINPIIINTKKELLAGFRRLSAAKMAGWVEIEAIVIKRDSRLEKLELEVEENLYRKDFTDDELILAVKKMEKLRRKNPLSKLWSGIKNFFAVKKGIKKRIK